MRKGDTGADVRDLQQRLAALGHQVEKDGWFGDKTEAAVRAFQRGAGLVADGIAGPKTLLHLSGRADSRLLRQADIDAAAERLGVAVAAVMAVNEVESRGSGFLPDGRPVILFERHIMHRQLAAAGLDADGAAARYPNIVGVKRGGYMGGTAEHQRLGLAITIDRDCALQSASWGQFQVMGFHWQTCGFASPSAFVEAMRESEGRQLAAFIGFIEADQALHKALKARKWGDFARIYNGPDYKENAYDAKLAAAYARHAAALEPDEETVA
ncbi:MAG: N-acetylmuramidase family protein [Pseudomonadota bacterium]